MKWWPRRKRKKPDGMTPALETARDQWQIHPETVIDVGAAKGKWSLRCAQVWPQARYLMVEPLAENQGALAAITQAHPTWQHIAAAAGATAGEVTFSVTPDLDGSAVYEDNRNLPQRTVPVVTLDDIAPPTGDCLLKLDTHGYEVPILKGATNLLPRCSLLVIECYGQRITSDTLLFHELCAWLAPHGFRTAAIVDVMQRPCDHSFWQADLFFLRDNHPVFKDITYH